MTLKYQLMIREVLRRETEKVYHKATHFLENGLGGIDIQAIELSIQPHVKKALELHAENVTHVAIADGIQEVSPENKLNAWADFPVNMAVELTLGTALAEKQKTIASDILANRQEIIRQRVFSFTKNVTSDYLKNIRKYFGEASKAWFTGDATAPEVKAFLQKALQSTDSYAEGVLRTGTTDYFNESRNSYFRQQTAVDFIELYAVTDGRISNICECRNHFVIPIAKSALKKYMPSFHPWCRTVQRPLFSSLPSHKLIIERGEAMNEASFVPLPKGWA